MTIPQENIRDRLLVARLPALPQVLIKLLALCQSDDTSMAELTALIATEPTLSSRLLAVAHSAAYHHGDTRLSLLQAANTLGTDMIKVLAISESVIQTFGAFSPAGSFDLRRFWKHSLTMAVVTKALAQQLDYPYPDDAYLIGLLHDVGRLALLASAPQAYQAQFMAADDHQLCPIERQTLGISHDEAGAWLLNHWHLPPQMAQAVLHHHEDLTQMAVLDPLAQLTRLAHTLLEWTPATSDERPDLDPSGKLHADTLALTLANAARQVSQTANDLQLDISVADSPCFTPLPPPVADAAQDQLAQEVRNRSLLTEMSHQLTQHASVATLLASVRHHAGILLDLDNVLLLLLGEDQHTLECVSVAPQHVNLATLSLDSHQHPFLTQCLQRQTLAMSNPGTSGDAEVCHLLASPHLMAVPLLTAKRVLGVLMAAVPATQLPQQQAQARLLLAFGLHAGAALSRHLQTAQALDARIASIKREQLVNARQLVHEVNNPMGIIKNYLEIIQEELEPRPQIQAALTVVGQEINRLGSIVEQFSEDPQGTVLCPVDLGTVVRELMHLLQASRYIPANIAVTLDWPNHTSVVLGSAGMVKQVLINLIKNARECMPNGGQMLVSGGERIEKDAQVFMTLSVSDTGPGLDSDLQAQLFQPVTSGKGGKYHGLGLSVVQQLVHKMGGQIDCRSGSAGARFDILLPCTDQPG